MDPQVTIVLDIKVVIRKLVDPIKHGKAWFLIFVVVSIVIYLDTRHISVVIVGSIGLKNRGFDFSSIVTGFNVVIRIVLQEI